jgi:hypothetical protein
MKEIFSGTTTESKRQKTEIMLAKDLTDPRKFAEITNGNLQIKHKIPWKIAYINGSILWAGYPKNQPNVPAATPHILHAGGGEWAGVDAAVVRKASIDLVRPGYDNDNVISGFTFSNGWITELRIPVTEASKVHLKARETARRLKS